MQDLRNIFCSSKALRDFKFIYKQKYRSTATFLFITGFGMLESGCVSIKNEVNIMMKNVVDIVLGGATSSLFQY